MWKSVAGLSFALMLVGCNIETPQKSETDPNANQTTEAVREAMNFSQDGDVFNIKTDEEFSIFLDLPEGTSDSTILWLPEQGGFGPHLKIVRSLRSVEGSLYFTEHQFRGGEPGQLVVTFAPKNGPKAVHDERRVITFNVE